MSSSIQDYQFNAETSQSYLNDFTLNSNSIIETSESNLNDSTLNSNNIILDTNINNDVEVNSCANSNVNFSAAEKVQSKETLQPLVGVFLPKTSKDWEEMNLFFHSSALFRFSRGVIENLDSAASEFNSAIYSYLKNRHGALRDTKKITLPGGGGFTALDQKYLTWSKSRIRRELHKLKQRKPVMQGSPLCDEIIYLSHRLRQDLQSGSVLSKPVSDGSFGSNFWSTCKSVFAGVTGAIPEFTIVQCGDYFARILSISDSLKNCLYQLPSWFVPLPAPSFPLDVSPPTYAEVASIIKKVRAGSSASPLDQISVITLKKCPILRTILHNIIAGCWRSQYTPKVWRVGVTILLYKKGDPSLVENFRPITLQSVPYKIFSAFIRNRLQTFLDVNKYHNNNIQKGFAHGQDGVLEHTEMLDFLMRDAKKTHRKYFVVLLDLRNAFGEVQHNLIRASLRYHHVPDSFIRVFDSIYTDFGIAVSSGGLLTEKILVKRGVLQGDPCSPLLFNLCFNSLMRLLETPQYKQMGYFWGRQEHQQCSWLQYADDALIMANSLPAAQCLVKLFEAWCNWAKMDIRLDKCLSFGAVLVDRKFQQVEPKIGLQGKGLIPPVPLGGHFKYLGKIFDFKSLNSEPKKEFESKLVKILAKISSLKVRSQTKLKIFSRYVPSQFNFELKIYNFTDAFLSGVIDRLCTMKIREWLEFPQSSCVTEWASTPINSCGLGIPTFAQRAARMRLTKRHLLQRSKNQDIRELWEESKGPNTQTDSLLVDRDHKQAGAFLRAQQARESSNHFLGLPAQGILAKTVKEAVLPKNIQLWKQALDSLSTYDHNFARKAMMNQLPTLHNLKIWNCSSSNQCPKCGGDQTNKHVLSNCSSQDALARYTDRHNRILEVIAKWIVPQLKANQSLYCDLSVPGTRSICDLFNGVRPDLAVVSANKIVVGELTVCHETNLIKSRDYKLNKYAKIEAARSSEFCCRPVKVHTIEVSTLGLVVAEPDFFKNAELLPFDHRLTKELATTALLLSKSIYHNK